jgi:pyruvate kinase
MRHTRIVCTLGPASSSEAQLEALMRAGMDVARLNFSHGTQEEHAATIACVRKVAARLDRPVALLQDLSGPKIRTGPLVGGHPVVLVDGAQVKLTTRPVPGTSEEISTTYTGLPADVKSGDRVLLSDGAIQLRVIQTTDTDVWCEVVHGGVLAEHQGINLPGVNISAPALTDKDRDDLRFGVRQGVDYIALSFVRRPEDVLSGKEAVAEALREEPRKDSSAPEGLHPASYGAAQTIPIIAKLEKPEAVENLEAILAVADGVMVARGDLGVEMPLEQVPVIQKRIIALANAYGLPVITATQMLESMIHQPRPTRAEASDVANAILDGTDAVMLSGETSIGEFPVEAVATMARIAECTEGQWWPIRADRVAREHVMGRLQEWAVSKAARTLAVEANVRLVVVFTRTGATAHLISKERPDVPIIAFTPFDVVYNRLALWWGILPRHSELMGTTDELIAWVDQELRSSGDARAGDDIVIMGGMPVVGQAGTNFVKLHRVGG